MGSTLAIDAASTVSGDIQSIDATVNAAPGAVHGTIVDLGPAFATFLPVWGAVGILVYLGWLALAVLAGLAVAGLAARQVQETVAIMTREPLLTVAAAIGAGVSSSIAAGLALLSVVGIPFGLIVLLVVLPAMLIAGYIVAAIGVGEAILSRATPGVTGARPYLASVSGLLVLGLLGFLPIVTPVAAITGFGAITVRMWRVLRTSTAPIAAARPTPASGPTA